MASDMNTVSVVGRLGKDPELRHLPSGQELAEFNIAVNSSSKDNATGEWGDVANWFTVTVFGKQAESVVKYTKKGHRIGVAGRLQQRTWEAEDGSKRERVGIVANSVHFLQPKGEGRAAQHLPEDDDTPF